MGKGRGGIEIKERKGSKVMFKPPNF